MTITTPARVEANSRLDAHLGDAPDGSPVTVHARGHILIQGRTGSGKSVVFEHVARQWRGLPGVNIAEVRYMPRDRVIENGHWGWAIFHNGSGAPATYERVLEFYSGLADKVRRPIPEPPEPPTLLLLEEVRLTTRAALEAIGTILTYGPQHGVHAVLGTMPMDHLVGPLRRLCATTVFLDPSMDHTVAAADARDRARKSGLDLPTGPGSFIVANDRCDVGRVPWQAPGKETQ